VIELGVYINGAAVGSVSLKVLCVVVQRLSSRSTLATCSAALCTQSGQRVTWQGGHCYETKVGPRCTNGGPQLATHSKRDKGESLQGLCMECT
jgi:hypothetical protein